MSLERTREGRSPKTPGRECPDRVHPGSREMTPRPLSGRKWCLLCQMGLLDKSKMLSSYDGEFRLPLVLAQGSPNFHSSCEGKLGIALE